MRLYCYKHGWQSADPKCLVCDICTDPHQQIQDWQKQLAQTRWPEGAEL